MLMIEKLTAFIAEWPELCRAPQLARGRAAEHGLLALDLPARLGGDGLRLPQLLGAFVAAGQHDANIRDYIGLGHARLLTLVETRRYDSFLKAVASGEKYAAVAITERTGGSDLKSLRVSAVPEAHGYRLSGQKSHVSRIEEASHAIVFAQVLREGIERLTCFLVDLDHPGVSRVRHQPVGLNSKSWGDLTFDDVFLPADARIGGEGQGFALFRKHFAQWRIFMAALAIGAGKGALALVRTRLRERTAFGSAIGRFTHLQQAYAQHATNLEAYALLVADAAANLDAGDYGTPYGAMTKAEVVEVALAAVDFGLRIFAAEGVEVDHPLRKLHGDLHALRIADGTTDVLRGQVARHFLGEDLYAASLGRSQSC